MMLCLQRTWGTPSSLSFLSKCRDHSVTYTSEMATVIKLQIYFTRMFHLADNINSNHFIMLNKTLTRTAFSNAYFVPLCIDSTLNCIFCYTAIPTRSNFFISNFDHFFMSGLSLPGLHFPRHTAGDHMFCETFSKTKDASVVEILVSRVSLWKYITPLHLYFIGVTRSKTTEKALMHLHQQSQL